MTHSLQRLSVVDKHPRRSFWKAFNHSILVPQGKFKKKIYLYKFSIRIITQKKCIQTCTPLQCIVKLSWQQMYRQWSHIYYSNFEHTKSFNLKHCISFQKEHYVCTRYVFLICVKCASLKLLNWLLQGFLICMYNKKKTEGLWLISIQT